VLKVRRRAPYFLERAKTQTIAIDVYDGAQRKVPSAATITVFDATSHTETSGKIVAGATATIASTGQVTYQITAATLPTTLDFSEDWLVEWSLTIDSVVEIFRLDCALVRRTYYVNVTHADVIRAHHELADPVVLPIGESSWDYAIEEADDIIQLHLLRRGRRPNLILADGQLFEPTLYLARSIAFRDLGGLPDSKYTRMATWYAEKFESAMGQIELKYDSDENNAADAQVPAIPIICTTQGPPRSKRYAWVWR